MADVAVDTFVMSLTSIYEALWGPYYINENDGVIIFGDLNNDPAYRTTDDGGATWSSSTAIDTCNMNRMACWFDKETPGDTGDLVHIAWTDRDNDDIYYRTFDISGGTLGTKRTVDSGVTVNDGANSNRLAITKTKNGNLLIGANTLTEFEVYRSTDSGANWTDRADVFESTTWQDYALFFPADTADDADACAVYWDYSANAITLKMYDDSANTWTESTGFTSATEHTNEVNLDGSVRHSDGHIIVSYHTDQDSSGDDIKCYDITPDSIASPTITVKTDVATNQSESGEVAVVIDQNTDDIYVAYLKGGTWNSTVDAVFHKSADGGTTWGSEQAYSEDTSDDLRRIQGGRTVSTDGGRIQWVFHNDDLRDILVNTNNDIGVNNDTNIISNDAASSTTASSPTITQTHEISVNDPTSATSTTEPAIVQTHNIGTNDATSSTTLTEPAITQTDEIASNNLDSSTVISSPTVAQIHVITSNDVFASSELTQSTIDESENVAPADLNSSSTLSQPPITQTNNATPYDMASSTILDSVGITGDVNVEDHNVTLSGKRNNSVTLSGP